ncbi:MAG: T9SS type A sorting domain-containing protein, partial [Bacteroidota bacterium]
VDELDVGGIDHNYIVPQLSPGLSPVSANGNPFYLTFTPTNPGPGDTLRIGVHLGTASQPVDSIYGLAFSVTYDAAIIDSGSIQVDYSQSWLGTVGTDLITVDKDFFTSSQIDIGISRIDQIQVAGFGRMAEIIVAIEDIVGKRSGVELLNFNLEHVSLLGKNGEALEAQTDSAQVAILLNNAPVIDESLAFDLYPNPASAFLNLKFKGGNTLRQGSILIRDLQGRLMYQTALTGKNQYRWNTQNLPTGMYLVEILAEDKRYTQKVIIRPE